VLTRTKRLVASLFASALLFAGIAAPSATAQQVGLVNVEIGDVTILRNVDVALAANVVANVCNIDLTAAVLAQEIEDNDVFECNQRGSGRSVAVTEA
jgi:hypothetical protein